MVGKIRNSEVFMTQKCCVQCGAPLRGGRALNRLMCSRDCAAAYTREKSIPDHRPSQMVYDTFLSDGQQEYYDKKFPGVYR